MIGFCWGDVWARMTSEWLVKSSLRCSWLVSFSSILVTTVALAAYLWTCSIVMWRHFYMSSTASLSAEMIPGNSFGCEATTTCKQTLLILALWHRRPEGMDHWQELTKQKLEVRKVVVSIQWVTFWKLNCWQVEWQNPRMQLPQATHLVPCMLCGRS